MAKTILLADDSLTIQKVVELTFAETEFEVVSTSNGDELLEKLSSTAPDIVVCDTIMPGIDGYDVCQQIKSDPASLHIPVIMLTGTFEPFDRDRALAVGCSEIITKPFEARKLVETVKNLVEGGGVAAPAPQVMEGAVKPPEFEGAVVPPVEEYGTMMMESPAVEELGAAPEEGLDFTSTGFAAMEAAGQADEEHVPTPPESGLDYEAPADDSGFAFSGTETSPAEETQPIPTEELAVARGEAEDGHWDGAAELEAEAPAPGPFGEEGGEAEIDTVPPEAFAAAEAIAAEEVDLESPEIGSYETAPEPDEAPVEAEVDQGAATMEELEKDYGVVSAVDEAPEEIPPSSEVAPEVPEVVEEFEEAAEAPEMVSEAYAFAGPTEEIPVVGEELEEPAAAVLEPIQEAITEPAPEAAPEAAAAAHSGALSDEDVDRIAHRVVELAADRLEKIAWDVIPDMAEIVIRERVRELEAQLEGEASVQ